MTISQRRTQRGVSLLEAVVALAVMAIGAVGIVGLQVSLRHNADLAKQRSEASRLAQEALEQARGFTSFSPVAGQTDWSMLVTGGPTTHVGSNTTFTRTVTVVARGEADDDPRSKTVHVRVAWADRTGDPQAVELNSIVSGIAPELTGSVVAPMRETLLKRPGWRHPAIPPAAIDEGNGTSRFDPPTGGTLPPVRWIFDNTTGHISKSCGLPLIPPADCSDVFFARLVAGYVAFATSAIAPTAADAEAPASPPQLVGVRVIQTAPADKAATRACYIELQATRVAYWCAVPVNSPPFDAWSGRVEVETAAALASAAPPASAPDAVAPTRQRVCRYTPVRGCDPAVGATIWGTPGSELSCSGAAPTASRPMTNEDHPLNYGGVKVPLVNQNFLIIRAGDGTAPFNCPGDNPVTPLINGNTWHHQPAS